MTVTSDLITSLAPTGILRAAINVGNPILANLDADGQPFGVSIDLARGLAQLLGVDIELLVFDAAGKSVETVTQEKADFGFFAVDPVRGAGIAFTAPYVLIEGAYLVREDSPITDNAEVDHTGNRVVVGEGSAYDLYLSREIKHAEILRSPTSPSVMDTFVSQGAEVAAGVKQQLEADVRRMPGLRLLPGRFMVIQQAMGLPKSRSAAAVQFLHNYVEDMKTSGFVAEALLRHGIQGAAVAPVESGN